MGQAPNPEYGATIPFLAFFVFQLTVAALTPALITGAFADRVPFGSYLVFLVFWSLLVYVPLAHWIWGGGFLQQWGVLDFGGGMVVHGAAGFSALASIYVVKKRVFGPGEEERPSNIPLIAIGLGLLWFGWLGDNPANALKADGVAAQAFVNTFIAGGCAMVVWMFTDWVRIGKASMVGSLTGVLAGLVAVTPCAGYVPTWAAVFIALAAGWICYGAVLLPQEAATGTTRSTSGASTASAGSSARSWSAGSPTARSTAPAASWTATLARWACSLPPWASPSPTPSSSPSRSSRPSTCSED